MMSNTEHEILQSVANAVTADFWHDHSNLVDLTYDTTPSLADKWSYTLQRRGASVSRPFGPVAEVVEGLATFLRALLLTTWEHIIMKDRARGDKIDFHSTHPLFFIETQPTCYRISMRLQYYQKVTPARTTGLSETTETEEDPMIQTIKSQVQYGESELFLQEAKYVARLRMFVFFQPISSTADIQARFLMEKFASGERMLTLNGSTRVKNGYIMWYGLFRPAQA